MCAEAWTSVVLPAASSVGLDLLCCEQIRSLAAFPKFRSLRACSTFSRAAAAAKPSPFAGRGAGQISRGKPPAVTDGVGAFLTEAAPPCRRVTVTRLSIAHAFPRKQRSETAHDGSSKGRQPCQNNAPLGAEPWAMSQLALGDWTPSDSSMHLTVTARAGAR